MLDLAVGYKLQRDSTLAAYVACRDAVEATEKQHKKEVKTAYQTGRKRGLVWGVLLTLGAGVVILIQ